MSLIGQPMDRVDGVKKLTGAATYTADVRLPGLALGVLVLSAIARGRIRSADVRKVSRMPGVLHVMTHLNAPRLPQGGRAAVNPPAGRVHTGRILNANLAEYHVPTNADIGVIDMEVVCKEDPHINSLGARGIGEIGITGVAAALANAVYHATGVRVRELPITLDKILAKQDCSAIA
jgi:CO/xanthine dehydrogenase Mo-binding subunit